VQLELGEETSAFGIGTFPVGASGTIVRDRGAAAGWDRDTPVIHYLLPGSSPAASPPARRNPVPGELSRTIVRKTPGCPAVPGGFRPVFSPAYRKIKKIIFLC